MFFMCPKCKRESEADVSDAVRNYTQEYLEHDLSEIEEIHTKCSYCNHAVVLRRPNDEIRIQLGIVQDYHESGAMTDEFCTSIKILIKQGYAYISGINRDGQPVLKSTEAGVALAEWWDKPATH